MAAKNSRNAKGGTLPFAFLEFLAATNLLTGGCQMGQVAHATYLNSLPVRAYSSSGRSFVNASIALTAPLFAKCSISWVSECGTAIGGTN